jgi:hypothetical protein
MINAVAVIISSIRSAFAGLFKRRLRPFVFIRGLFVLPKDTFYHAAIYSNGLPRNITRSRA